MTAEMGHALKDFEKAIMGIVSLPPAKKPHTPKKPNGKKKARNH